MEITIDIDDYISEEEKKSMARSAFRDVCIAKSNKDYERIISNAAYEIVHKEMDACFDGGMRETVKQKVIKIISNESNYGVFRKADAWEKGESKGYTYMQQALEENKGLIAEKVAESIESTCATEIIELLQDRFLDAMVDRLTRKE